ncbi:MAG: hypothetical protein ACXWX7_21760 [Candidatus Binatia bacterium]
MNLYLMRHGIAVAADDLGSNTEVANVLQQAAKVQESWVTWKARATVD